jgi:hypothetical protein
MKPGDVIYIWLDETHLGGGADYKYCISVDPKEKRFLLINSEPRRSTPTLNVPVTNKEVTELTKATSYIDGSRLINLTKLEFDRGMKQRKAHECGPIPPAVVKRILSIVDSAKTIPNWQKELIKRHLTAAITET